MRVYPVLGIDTYPEHTPIMSPTLPLPWSIWLRRNAYRLPHECMDLMWSDLATNPVRG